MKFIKPILIILSLGLIANCVSTKATIKKEDLKISLRWIQAYPEENKEKVEIGLQWMMSYLGASIPEGSLSKAIIWKSATLLELDLTQFGFEERALLVWAKLLEPFRRTEEYKVKGGIDLGRFMLICFNNSWHYYALTNVVSSFQNFESSYHFKKKLSLKTKESTVAFGPRILYNSTDSTDLSKIAYYAIEGHGKLSDESFKPNDFEVYDFMSNGQPRFAIYDIDGNLKAASDARFSIGGKPAKCMWCHESNIQPSFKKKLNKKLKDFNELIHRRRNLLLERQLSIKTDLNFDSLMHHRNSEFFYASFMEPSLNRLSQDWNIDTLALKKMLVGLKTHTSHDYPELGNIYDYREIKHLYPYKALDVPGSPWHGSGNEKSLLE